MAAAPTERNQEATVYVGELAPQVSEELLWELFLQCGPVVNVYIPRDKLTQAHSGYGFVEFRSEEDADYALKVMNMVNLYQRAIRVNKASKDRQDYDCGANIFVGNLDPDCDEKLLYETFSTFGRLLEPPRVMRDADSGISKGYAFIKFDSFESSDAAIDAMNGQYVCNRPIHCQYMYKKDSRERHGDQSERMLAARLQAKRGFAPSMPIGMGASVGFLPLSLPQPFQAAPSPEAQAQQGYRAIQPPSFPVPLPQK